MKKKNIAIVMTGGGMQCAYGGGALLALAERFKLTKPSLIIAASGSVGSAAYYKAGQYEKIPLGWMQFTQNPNVASLLKRPIMNLDYLVDELYRKKYPLDFRAFSKSTTPLLLPVIRYTTGKLTYLKAPPDERIFTEMRAAMAAPFIYGKRVKIGKHYYIDGGVGPTFHDFLRKAVQEEAQHIILLASRTKMNPIAGTFFKTTVLKGNPLKQTKSFIRIAQRATTPVRPFVPPEGVNLITVAPTKKLPVSLVGGTAREFRETFDMGYTDAVNHPELEELLLS